MLILLKFYIIFKSGNRPNASIKPTTKYFSAMIAGSIPGGEKIYSHRNNILLSVLAAASI